MFETEIRDGVLRTRRPNTRWLSTGWAGGRSEGPVAYNVSVPEGWDRTDLDVYVKERLSAAGFDATDPGPTLLTGVDMQHARGARCGPVEVVATAGVSNPAELPMDPAGERTAGSTERRPGTVNLLVGTTRSLTEGALADLLARAAEAKTTTLLETVGVPGTTTDAIVVGCDPDGDPTQFAGSGTEVGACTRACVREAVRASLDARYGDEEPPGSVAAAEYGVVTDRRAAVFKID